MQQTGDRAYEAKTLGALARCKTAGGEYAQATTYHTEQWALAQELGLAHEQTSAALELGVVMWGQTRVEHHDSSAAFVTPSAYGRPASYMDRMRNAAQWLGAASRLAQTHRAGFEYEAALLHLSFLVFDLVEEEEVLDRLKQCL